VPYEGKRVGVIGSGCSAAQVVPAIASEVDRLTVFTGKAQWIIPRSDRIYSPVERFLVSLPGIRHLNRLIVFGYHEVRFAAFRRWISSAMYLIASLRMSRECPVLGATRPLGTAKITKCILPKPLLPKGIARPPYSRRRNNSSFLTICSQAQSNKVLITK